MANRRNTVVVEDAIKVIYTVGEWDPRGRTVSEIAEQLGATTSTTSGLVKRLADEGLVSHQRYGDVELTPAGIAAAMRIVRRHRLIETFLVQQLRYTWDEVHDEAEVLEHAMSDLMLSRVDDLLGHPWRDPHGDAIPTPDGVLHLPEARPLAALAVGDAGYVVRIRDESPELLRWLDDHGVVPDVAVTVLEQSPFAGTVRLDVDGRPLDLGLQAVDALWIGPDLPLADAAPFTCHYPACRHVGEGTPAPG